MEESYPTCTSAACRTRAPALLVTAIGIGLVAGLMLESVLGLTTPIALGVLLAAACCARKRLAAGQRLPFGKAALLTAAAVYALGGFGFTAYVDIVDPSRVVDSLVVGGLFLCGGTVAAGVFLGICGLVNWLRDSPLPPGSMAAQR